MDARLHADRLVSPGNKRTYRAEIATLPDGAFIERDGDAWLIWRSSLLRWTPGGYDQRIPRPAGGEVTVLTPSATVETIAAGYLPGVHPSTE